MDRTINELMIESNINYKLMNEKKTFSSNKKIKGNKPKPISITLENVRKGKRSRSVHSAGLSCLWDTG